MICLTPKLSQGFFVYGFQSKENFFYWKRAFFGKGGEKDWTKNEKKAF